MSYFVNQTYTNAWSVMYIYCTSFFPMRYFGDLENICTHSLHKVHRVISYTEVVFIHNSETTKWMSVQLLIWALNKQLSWLWIWSSAIQDKLHHTWSTNIILSSFLLALQQWTCMRNEWTWRPVTCAQMQFMQLDNMYKVIIAWWKKI
jgi:hypothetical protein